MVKWIFIFFMAFFVICNIYLILFMPSIGSGENDRQKNIIAAQEYIDYNTHRQIVLAGSSCTRRLDSSMLPHYIYNLAFGGENMLTGLEIIRRCPVKPRIVLIELNQILLDMDSDFVASLFTPILYKIRPYVPSLQEKYQFINLILPRINKTYLGPNYYKSLPKEQLEKMANDENSENSKTLNYSKLDNHINLVKNYINENKAKAIKTVLYLLPWNCLVNNNKINDYLRLKFPINEYQWIESDSCINYSFNDLHHFDVQGARKYSIYLKSQIEKLFPDIIINRKSQ